MVFKFFNFHTSLNQSEVILLIGLVTLGSCKQHTGRSGGKNDSINSHTDSAAVAVDTVIRYLSYTATLPCPDCQGIQTTINLMGDYSYQKLSSHLGKKGKIAGETFDETGRWMLRGRDTVQLMDVTDGPNKYLKTDSSLVQLDLNGARIAGPQAAQYEFKKIK